MPLNQPPTHREDQSQKLIQLANNEGGQSIDTWVAIAIAQKSFMSRHPFFAWPWISTFVLIVLAGLLSNFDLALLLKESPQLWVLAVLIVGSCCSRIFGHMALSDSYQIRRGVALARLPATLLHEIAHGLGAVIGLGLPLRLRVWPPRLGKDSSRYGYIWIKRFRYGICQWTFPLAPLLWLVCIGALTYFAKTSNAVWLPCILIAQVYMFVAGWPSIEDWQAIPISRSNGQTGIVLYYCVGNSCLGLLFLAVALYIC